MIIEKSKFAEMMCPMSIGRGHTHQCIGEKCFAFEDTYPKIDYTIELERVEHRIKPPGPDWQYNTEESKKLRESGTGDGASVYIQHPKIEQATCGMIPKDVVTLEQ